MSRPNPVPILLSCLGFCTAAAPASRTDVVEAPSCGPKALYLLLRIEGRPVSLEGVASSLPASPPGGHSLQELIDSARAHQVELVGVRVDRIDRLDRPIIALVRGHDRGHFITLMPSRTDPTRVVALDPSGRNEIRSIAGLTADPGWTGMALAPVGNGRPSAVISLISCLTATVGGLAAAAVALGPPRRARAGRSRRRVAAPRIGVFEGETSIGRGSPGPRSGE